MLVKSPYYRFFRFIMSCYIALLLCIVLLLSGSGQALAATYDVGEETITLNGSFDGQFTLDSDSSELFYLEGAVPGDSWIGRITIKNSAPAKMDVALLSIVNELDDELLFNVLKLDIKSGKEFIYSGSYGETVEPITKFYTLKPGEEMHIDARVTLPVSAGNEVQNRRMDSKWIFEARYYGQTAVQTGDDIISRTVRDGTTLWIVLFALVAAAIVFVRYIYAKKRIRKTEREGDHSS